MFDKYNQIYNSTIYGASLPGLGRNLMILIVIELKELINEYYFLLNKNYELMAVSENFEKNYDMSMPLIEKFGINILDIFEINLDKLKIDFQEDIKKILNLKHNMEIMTGEYFTKRLFRQNTKAGGKYNLNKFKLLDELEKEFRGDSNGTNMKFIRKLKQVQLMIEKIYNHNISESVECSSVNLRINKQSVINNLVKVVNKLTEVDLHDEAYKKLTESVFKFKNYNHIKEEDNNNMVKGQVNNNTYDSYFDIEARISVLYDTPFYAFKLTEITKTTPGIQNINDSGSINSPSIRSQRRVTFNSRTGGSNTQSISLSASNNKTISTRKKLNNIQNNVKNNEIKCFRFIIYIIIILLAILLIIYICIIFYQNNIISTGQNIFLGLYYNYYQRDKLLCLFASILSSYYFLSDITNYNDTELMSNTLLQGIMKSYSFDFQNSFHYFYTSYIDYKKNLNEPLTALYLPRTMNKISTDWNNIKYESDYISEAEFISYSAHNAALDLKNIEKAKTEDCPQLFQATFNKTQNNRNKEVFSNFITCMYYLCRNYNSQFYFFYQELQVESETSFLNFSKGSKKIYILIEVLGMILYIIFFGVMFFYLYQSNSMMFKNILNMFLDFTQEGPYNFKNHIDNFILIKKISEFNLLLVDFSLGILDKYNKKISSRSVISGNMNMSLDGTDGQGFGVGIKADKTKDDIDNIKKEKEHKKKKKDKKKEENKDKSLNAKNPNNIGNNSKIDTSKGGLLVSTNTNFNKLNNPQGTLKKNNINSSTNILLNTNITTSNSQKNFTIGESKKAEKREEIDDNAVTTDIILSKTQNKGILQIKLIIYAFVILFLVILIYFFVKLIISIGFIDDIKNIFDDFGTVSFKYSMVYYYFNTLRVLLVVPTFTDEKIFLTMTDDLIKETNNINNVLNYRMKNYASTNILFTAFTRSQNDTSITNIQEIICENDLKCHNVLNDKTYNMLSDGIDVAINAMVQETQNLYNDYIKIYIENITMNDISQSFINIKFKQVDINLNFVLSLVQERIYNAFLKDANALTNKFQKQINIFNSCAIIYCCLLGTFVVIYVVNKIQRMTKVVEVSTMRLNRAFCFIKENNLGNQINPQTNSFLV